MINYKLYNLSKLLIMCYEYFQYSCSIEQKRRLITKAKDFLYKTIGDKVLCNKGKFKMKLLMKNL